MSYSIFLIINIPELWKRSDLSESPSEPHLAILIRRDERSQVALDHYCSLRKRSNNKQAHKAYTQQAPQVPNITLCILIIWGGEGDILKPICQHVSQPLITSTLSVKCFCDQVIDA